MDSTNSVWSVAVSSRAKCTLIGCTRKRETYRAMDREREREKEKEKTSECMYVCVNDNRV
jgi:hypothetical protein